MDELEKYGNHYSKDGFFDKCKQAGQKAGMKVIYAALLLFYVLEEPSTPVKEKTLIIGALGYLILPVDLISDAIPVFGFSDDLTALVYALHQIRAYITPNVEQKARQRLATWFTSIDENELNEILK